MAKYRKKPVIINAFIWTGDKKTTICDYEELIEVKQGNIIIDGDKLIIKTLEGDMTASKGDYVIRGVNGEYYPCKPDIFAKTYELVDGELEISGLLKHNRDTEIFINGKKAN